MIKKPIHATKEIKNMIQYIPVDFASVLISFFIWHKFINKFINKHAIFECSCKMKKIDNTYRYCAKLLLFGEYTIIDGGQAIVVPFDTYFGSWSHAQSLEEIKGFLEFAQTLDFIELDLPELESLKFDSTIPIGYGVGSSGALSAAVYKTFAKHKSENIEELRTQLSLLESYFHGSSSGVDPLCSYLNKPVIIKGTDYAILDKMPNLSYFFLVDSNIARQTKPFVKLFQIKKQDEQFSKILRTLNKENMQSIESLLQDDQQRLKEHFFNISRIQFDHFQEMIPDHIKAIWKLGLDTEEYAIKLSGAGGGGFFLGYGKVPISFPEIQFISLSK